MDSPRSAVSPLHTSPVVFHEPGKRSLNVAISREINAQSKETIAIGGVDEFVGALDVHIHQARDIHNICIYQKQDVYAKLCLTSDPENTVATKIKIGGGRNPVFDEKLRVSVDKVDSSLKCEIWMLSRVQNYLEDQLLGFALVPVSEILLHGGNLEKDLSLSSTDLFHSPAGFVELSISYVGAAPEVIPITMCVETDPSVQGSESNRSPLNGELDKIEFPDPKVANENHQMVEEYFEICTKVESQQCSECLVISDDTDKQQEESCSDPLKADSSLSSVSSTETSIALVPVSFPKDSESPILEEHFSPPPPPKDGSKEKSVLGSVSDSNTSTGDSFAKPLASVNIDSEPKMVQQDIVDMYMKSMQQFTESLAKMKLPMDYENGPSSSDKSTASDQKTPSSKNSGSRVFYGSRAFF